MDAARQQHRRGGEVGTPFSTGVNKLAGRHRGAVGWGAGLLVAVLLGWVTGASQGQQLPNPPAVNEAQRSLPLQSILLDAERRAAKESVDAKTLRETLAKSWITLREDGKVHVEIIGPADREAIAAEVLAGHGGEVSNTWRNRTEAWVPISQLSAVAKALPGGYYLERAAVPGLDAVGGEGAVAINSDSYRDAGRNGSGLTFAVIDSGYINLTAARNAGDAPASGNTTAINYTGSGFQSGTAHGTGCVEAAFDHCPGATWRLYKIDSLTDLGVAVSDGLANGVDVFTHSISWYNTGWADNTGTACAAANNAASNGAMFYTSAGNRAQQHWQGDFNTGSDADNWHDWVNGDETINITVAPGAGGNFYLQWDTSGGTFDYDLYLYDQDVSTILASSTNSGENYESFGWTSPFASNRTVHLAVSRNGTGTTELEVFLHSSGNVISFQHAIAAGSTTSPSNATYYNVISNGAVDEDLHTSGNGTTGIIKSYSSQGPSNGGMTLPDLAGPTDTGTTAYGGAFGGTSCATPNNAGAACAFWSADTQLSRYAVSWLLFQQAELWKDWGAGGADNIYGWGGTILTDYDFGTIWVARTYNNTGDDRMYPFYTVQAAYDAVVNGGRLLIFPGGSYPESVSMTGTKYVEVQTLEANAHLGF